MHSQFSEWFLSAGIPLQDELLQKRWAGVEGFSAENAEIVPLVELFFGLFEPKEAFLQSFRAPFKQADGALPASSGASICDGGIQRAVVGLWRVEPGPWQTLVGVLCGANGSHGRKGTRGPHAHAAWPTS